MGENSKIEWCDNTFNPWLGCTKVAAGCAHCYAETLMDSRYRKAKWGPGGTRVLTSAANWQKPLAWNKAAEAAGVRQRVFCASLADVFEDWGGPISAQSGDVWTKPYLQREWGRANWTTCDAETMQRDPQGWQFVTLDDVRRELFALIDATPWLDWLLLTKRPENVLRMWPECSIEPNRQPHSDGRHNVWIGCSIATQADADRNIPELLQCRDLSPVLFVSAEPLLGPVDLRKVTVPPQHDVLRRPWDTEGFKFNALQEHDDDRFHQAPTTLDWVICGGESGPHARPMHPDWARQLRDQCQAADVRFLFKQWGEWLPFSQWSWAPPEIQAGTPSRFRQSLVPGTSLNGTHQSVVSSYCVGKKAAGRLLDGVEYSECPQPHAPA